MRRFSSAPPRPRRNARSEILRELGGSSQLCKRLMIAIGDSGSNQPKCKKGLPETDWAVCTADFAPNVKKCQAEKCTLAMLSRWVCCRCTAFWLGCSQTYIWFKTHQSRSHSAQ